MESQYLKTLLTIIETGSFSRTAETLNITQSAVSHRIKYLEEHYNCVLIDRTTQTLEPTDSGKILAKKAAQILSIEKEIAQELKQVGKKSRLAICATATYGIIYLPNVMNRFLHNSPQTVDLNFILLTPEEATRGLLENRYDIGVIEHINPLDLPGFQCYELPPDDMVFVCSPSLDISGEEVPLERIQRERLITRKEGCSCRDLLDNNFARSSITTTDFRSTVIYDDLHFIIHTVVSGSGVAFVSRSLVREYIERGELKAFRIKGFTHSRKRTAAVRRKKLEDRTIAFFMECLFAETNTVPRILA